MTSSPAAGITWNLDELYASPEDPKLLADRDGAALAAVAFEAKTRGRLAQMEAPDLGAAMAELEALLVQIYRPMIYAELRFAADSQNAANGALLAACREAQANARARLIFFDLEWLALADERALALLAHPALGRWAHHLRKARAQKPHTLSEGEEKILEMKSLTGRQAFVRLFDENMAALRTELPSTDGATPSATLSLGSATPSLRSATPPLRSATLAEALSWLYRPERETRKTAATAITAALEGPLRQAAYITNTLVNEHAIEDALRKRPHPMLGRNLDNEITQASVDALLATAEAGMPLVARYYQLKARLLGLGRLADYDRYAPIRADQPVIPWPEAKRMVLDAYRAFHPHMAEIAQLFFDKRWIDAEARPGKSGGAFSASTLPDLHPYILMNYQGSPRDVMTLAHELGHGVHQYLSGKQGLLHMNTPLTTAETASVFGEFLVFRALLAAEADPQRRLALLCGKLEDAFATVFRQAVMTRFEQKVHAARRAQGELTPEAIGALWLEANAPMFGDAVEMTPGYALWWSYIPHFIHTPFYCYAYSFGELLVLALLDQYDQEGEAFKAKYLGLLEAGGSASPAELLAKVGQDITHPDFWQKGIHMLEGMVQQAEALAG